MNTAEKLREYQFNLYKENTVKLKDLRFECRECNVYFTPSEARCKELMKNKGVVNECKDCEKSNEMQ
jgi:hypothetical protein